MPQVHYLPFDGDDSRDSFTLSSDSFYRGVGICVSAGWDVRTLHVNNREGFENKIVIISLGGVVDRVFEL